MAQAIEELCHVYERIVHVELQYPRIDDSMDIVEIGLCDVRAADDIRISYDFYRDGWSIKQASVFEWEVDDTENNQDWQEVAFVKAWARQKKKEVHN